MEKTTRIRIIGASDNVLQFNPNPKLHLVHDNDFSSVVNMCSASCCGGKKKKKCAKLDF